MKFTIDQIRRIIKEELISEASVPSYTPTDYGAGINKTGDNAVSNFHTSAVDSAASSLWKNYWIPARPVVTIARGLGIIDHVNPKDKKQIRETAQALQHIQKEGFRRIKEDSTEPGSDWSLKHFKWAKQDELKVIQFLIGMSHGGIGDVLKDMKKNPSAFKSFVKTLAIKGLHEGFGGALKKEDRKKFDDIRRRQAEVLGYTLTGKDDIKTEIGDATITEGVADEIMKQIPRRTLSYVGAKNFAKGKSSKGEFLEFTVKGSKLKSGGRIKVIYNKGGDDYVIEAWQIRGTNVKLIKKQDRIQVNKLGRTIENLVG